MYKRNSDFLQMRQKFENTRRSSAARFYAPHFGALTCSSARTAASCCSIVAVRAKCISS